MNKHFHYSGLNNQEVTESRSTFGSNIITPPQKESLWKMFFEKLTGPFGHYISGWNDGDHLIFILEVAAILSGVISLGEYYAWIGHEEQGNISVFFEPLGILIAILLATGISFYFEMKAEQEFTLLNKVNDEDTVQVFRNGYRTSIAKKDIVVGDIIVIETGNEVPADATLIEATMLKVDESSLTGEPICYKTIKEEEFDAEATFPSNHMLRGTKVMEGYGIAKVYAVGDQTENGKVMQASQIDDTIKTPLNEQLDNLGKKITILSYTLATLIIIGKISMFFILKDFEWIHFISYLIETLMIAVTLIVVSVPEGLPMAVSLALALSMRKMLKTNNLVRKMHACETMGATTIICTDKTGTLTQNQMNVSKTKFYLYQDKKLNEQEIKRIIIEGISSNTTAQLDESNPKQTKVLGNPTEGALLLWLKREGYDYQKYKQSIEVLQEIPFSTERKYMATIVKREDNKKYLYVKGAPEIVFSLCKQSDQEQYTQTLQKDLEHYQNQAMRTLGFAYQEIIDEKDIINNGVINTKDCSFVGIVAISDPIREDVPMAVSECIKAGINIKIVTGDTSRTAIEIGRQIGLWNDKTDNEKNIISGNEFTALTDQEIESIVSDLKIIYRARPLEKKRLVEILQKKGDIVAVTGDGTNDAPALKTAHVGLSMGDGTAVAKEASDITIIDNSFASIGRAVMWGRSLYQNIQRFILFQMTVNVVASLIVLAGAFMGTESPLTVTQMLWVNLIMDTFAAIALAGLPPSETVMNEKPRNRNAFIISPNMKKEIFGFGSIFFFILLVLLYIFEHADIQSLTDLIYINIGNRSELSTYELSLFFTIFVMLQFWNMFNAKAFTTNKSALSLIHAKSFLSIALIILIGQIIIVTTGGELFNVKPLKIKDWIIIIILTSTVLWFGEIKRLLKRTVDKQTTI